MTRFRGEPSAEQGGRPWWERDLGVLGGLPWDTERAELQKMAQEILTICACPADAVVSIRPVLNRERRGSRVEIQFASAAALQDLRSSMREKQAELPHGGAWLDVVRSREELRPSRMTHRAAACLKELLSGKEGDHGEITKNLRWKAVYLGQPARRMFWVVDGRLEASEAAKSILSPEEVVFVQAAACEE